MSGLHMAAVKIVVGEDRAAHGTDHDAPVLDAKVRHSLANELMQNTVATAGTVMGGSGSTSAFSGKLGIYARMPTYHLLFSRHF